MSTQRHVDGDDVVVAGAHKLDVLSADRLAMKRWRKLIGDP